MLGHTEFFVVYGECEAAGKCWENIAELCELEVGGSKSSFEANVLHVNEAAKLPSRVMCKRQGYGSYEKRLT